MKTKFFAAIGFLGFLAACGYLCWRTYALRQEVDSMKWELAVQHGRIRAMDDRLAACNQYAVDQARVLMSFIEESKGPSLSIYYEPTKHDARLSRPENARDWAEYDHEIIASLGDSLRRSASEKARYEP